MKPADLRLLLGYALPYRAALALCALLMLAESAMALAVPWLRRVWSCRPVLNWIAVYGNR